MKKHILVVGLKTLGMSIVKQLAKYNCEVLAIDKDAFFVINDCYEVNGGVKKKNLPFI